MHNIGVLDSGIGGLTTAYCIFQQISSINVIYYADNLNAPYGTKNPAEVYAAVKQGVEYLLSRKVEAVVLACNTATATCIDKLRAEFDVPFIGIEPAVKPAKKEGGKTLYLATPLTLKTKGDNGFLTVDTTYLATMIEVMAVDKIEMEKLAEFAVKERYENIILGCTHYSHLTPYIQKLYPTSAVFDGNGGVSRQVNRVIKPPVLPKNGRLYLTFSGKKEYYKYINVFYSLQ